MIFLRREGLHLPRWFYLPIVFSRHCPPARCGTAAVVFIKPDWENEMSRPIDFSTLRDDELTTANTAVVVLNAYSTTMAVRRDGREAFEAAVRAWQERHPEIGVEEARTAVANILCHKL